MVNFACFAWFRLVHSLFLIIRPTDQCYLLRETWMQVNVLEEWWLQLTFFTIYIGRFTVSKMFVCMGPIYAGMHILLQSLRL